MANLGVFAYITDEFIDKFAIHEEKFNIFIASGFIKNEKYTKAIQQLELGITSSHCIVSYLMLIAISIHIEQLDKIDEYIKGLNNKNSILPKEVLTLLEKILSNVTPSETSDIKQNTKLEKLINILCTNDKHFYGWVSFKGDNTIESKFSVSEQLLNFIKNIHSYIVTNDKIPFHKVLGNVEKVSYEFVYSKIYYTSFEDKHLYFIGDEEFSTNYILIKLKE